MGPYPHDAPPAVISEANPAGTDGFEFVEFAHPDLSALHALFDTMGLVRVAQHKRKAVSLWRQGEINFLASGEPHSHAAHYAVEHGPCAASMAWRVVDAEHAFEHAVAAGAEPARPHDGATTVDAPAIRGIGGSLLYFIDRQADGNSAYDAEFDWVAERDAKPAGLGLHYIDHLTHNVKRGRMNEWSGFTRNFSVSSKFVSSISKVNIPGYFSRAMTSPCGKIRIPINESADAHSQIEEYLRDYNGEGIQHVACGSTDIYASVDALTARGLPFMPAPPKSYYGRLAQRLPGHGERVERLAERGILIDGEGVVDGESTKILLQIFSGTVLGPIFFEFIQRKGDDGFGEGNFRALFESIEEDQIRRGVIGTPA